MSRLNVLFPIEFLNRELDARLFLACKLARPDLRIIIGHDDAIHKLLPSLRGGIYVGRNIHRPRFPDVDQSLYRLLKSRDFVFVHLDEEGAVHPGDEENWRRVLQTRLDPNCLAEEDAICTWGDWQRNVYQSLNPPCEKNIQATGHPRFDLYAPQYREYFASEIEAIRQQYGEFVLINTNLFRANNRRGISDTFSRKRGYIPQEAAARNLHTAHWAYHTRVLTHFVELVTHLSTHFPKLNIVLRPHPSENFDFYHSIFDGVPNVHVVHEGSVAPWLMAASTLIHDGCTTAIEAHLCGTPIINYKPLEDERFDKFLPNLFGKRCDDKREVVDVIVTGLDSPVKKKAALPQRALELLLNFQSESFPRLEAAVNEALVRVSCDEPIDSIPISAQVRKKLGALQSSVARTKHDSRFDPRFGFRPFYGFEHCDLSGKWERVQRITGRAVRYELIGNDLITVEAG